MVLWFPSPASMNSTANLAGKLKGDEGILTRVLKMKLPYSLGTCPSVMD